MLTNNHKDKETKEIFLQVDHHIQILALLLNVEPTIYAVLICKGVDD